jgi:hypothetical protein
MQKFNHPIYKTATGEVVKLVGFIDEDIVLESDESYYVNTGSFLSSDTQYFPSGVLTTRPIINTLSWDTTSITVTESATLSGIPVGSFVKVSYLDRDFKIQVDDGEFVFSAIDLGLYKIEVFSFPNQKYSQIIEVV